MLKDLSPLSKLKLRNVSVMQVNSNRLLLCLLVLLSLALTSVPLSFGQSKPQPRRKLKDFGSSLKRLKWNPAKKETVETKPIAKGSTGDEEDVIRVETSLVAWDVLVLDKDGNNVSGLTGADFAISEEGIPQEVGHFLLGDNQSVARTIALIIDYSGSQLPFLRNSIDAAKVLVDQLAPLDKMAIITDDVELIQDFTDDKNQLKKKLESLFDRTKRNRGFFSFSSQRIGQSKQYSALMATLNEAFTDEDKRPIIVFQTDGDEAERLRDPVIRPAIPPGIPDELQQRAAESVEFRQNYIEQFITEFSLADVYRAAEKSRATIYTIVPGAQLIGRKPEEQVKLMRPYFEHRFLNQFAFDKSEVEQALSEARKPWRSLSDEIISFRTKESYIVQLALAGVAGRTGGWTDFLEKPEQAARIYSRIFSDINQRYIIGYYPTNKDRDGKRRRINVEVKGHPEYFIVGRKSYYAPVE